ncbi:hypothetical protein J3U42_02470 [Gilliamella sp. B2923]|uniref:hypothetical protein n=1 Tax=unclassified Gilliamella TaxID=2685620 RepID=UPI001C6A2647|nr:MULTISPECIES: hypothetical protein [unclassified Gilliamella]MCX8617252.1 hypothetical protein [Gilliamella sp. B2923]QYN47149.1 hypothetical protein GYM74_08025 [Gilliamella sp. ESL0405]
MRIVLAILLVFCLNACHVRTADKAYQQGQYVESISLLTSNINEKGEAKFNDESAEKLRVLVSNVMAHYETIINSSVSTDYQARIDSYESLRKINLLLVNRFYSQTVAFFNDKYAASKLDQLIAKEYYDYGNSIKGTDSDSYKIKANLYLKGSERYKYKDIFTLYKNAKKQQLDIEAKHHYDLGKTFSQQGNYNEASLEYLKAWEVYKPLGEYKDSYKLYEDNKRKHVTALAKEYYERASLLEKTAYKRETYREAAKNYEAANLAYQHFGQYRDASARASRCKLQGRVNVYVKDSDYLYWVKQVFKEDYIYFVDRSSQANVIIDINATSDYIHMKPYETNEAKTERYVERMTEKTDDKGNKVKVPVYKEQHFNLKTITYAKKYSITTRVDISGDINYSSRFSSEAISTKTDYIYSGNVPSKYRNSSEGESKSKSTLKYEAESEQGADIRQFLSRFVDRLSSI